MELVFSLCVMVLARRILFFLDLGFECVYFLCRFLRTLLLLLLFLCLRAMWVSVPCVVKIRVKQS